MSSAMHHPFLIGEKCYLRGLEESDIGGAYFQWFNDQSVTRYMFNGAFPNSNARMMSFFNKVSEADRDLVLAIICKADGIHVGNVGLHNINWLYRCSELGIIIGEKSYHGKGIAKESLKLILRHAFMRLNLHKIYLMTDAGNEAALRVFQQVGFAREGLLRQDCFRNGKYSDSVYMGCLVDDFLAATLTG